MNALLLVGAGGAVGASLRYLVSGAVGMVGGFPAGTLTVNLLGSFGLGLLMFSAAAGQGPRPEMRYLLGTGMFGGFTTFSTFAYESFWLMEEGETLLFAGNVVLNVALCLLGVMVARFVVLQATA